jgi:hypothetical protein
MGVAALEHADKWRGVSMCVREGECLYESETERKR